MNALEALTRLRSLGSPALRTSDAAAALGLKPAAASVTLKRLSNAKVLTRVRSGLWWLDAQLDPLRLPEFLTAPQPSYVSLQSALSVHGLIEQLPAVTYAVSLARTQRVETAVGVVSIHHLEPALFGGFETTRENVRLASPEKALFDLAYLSGGRSRLFASVPELFVPRSFSMTTLHTWVKRVRSARHRTLLNQRLDLWLAPKRRAQQRGS